MMCNTPLQALRQRYTTKAVTTVTVQSPLGVAGTPNAPIWVGPLSTHAGLSNVA